MANDLVLLFDVDNTLLDNDRLIGDLMAFIEKEVGPEQRARYQAILEQLRTELGYVDYLGALQRFRLEHPADPKLLWMSSFLIDYPFAQRLYPRALEVITYCRQWGPTVILSDGDVVFQPRKIQRSGLWDAVEGRALIFIHKEQMLDVVEQRFPARRYVMIDDKLRILTAMKNTWGSRLTTIFPRQGHYAHDSVAMAGLPPADITVEAIGEILSHDLSERTLNSLTSEPAA